VLLSYRAEERATQRVAPTSLRGGARIAAMPTAFNARPSNAEPVLPTAYDVPWSRRVAMFPKSDEHNSASRRAPFRSPQATIPYKQRSMFGPQWTSLHESPPGMVMRVTDVEIRSRRERELPSKEPLTTTWSSLGAQPLSSMRSQAGFPRLSEDRWAPTERKIMSNVAPGPQHYYNV
jgi:hypothetical protein